MSETTPGVERIAVDVPSTFRGRVKDFLEGLVIFGANQIGRVPIRALRNLYYRHVLGWHIASGASINTGLKVYGGRGKVWIGRNSTIQIDCLIAGIGMVDLRIGDNVAIAYRCSIILGAHDLDTFKGRVTPITIEDYVFVGAGAMVLEGVTLGRGSVVAAGAVVSKSVAPYTIVGGNPAKPIGERRRDLNYSTENYWLLH